MTIGSMGFILGGVGFLVLSGGSTDSPVQAAEPRTKVAKVELSAQTAVTEVKQGGIGDASEARKIIDSLRNKNGDINLNAVFTTAEQFSEKGRLADAQLLYFFSARRGHAWSAFK